jgi:hypothetical protein
MASKTFFAPSLEMTSLSPLHLLKIGRKSNGVGSVGDVWAWTIGVWRGWIRFWVFGSGRSTGLAWNYNVVKEEAVGMKWSQCRWVCKRVFTMLLMSRANVVVMRWVIWWMSGRAL